MAVEKDIFEMDDAEAEEAYRLATSERDDAEQEESEPQPDATDTEQTTEVEEEPSVAHDDTTDETPSEEVSTTEPEAEAEDSPEEEQPEVEAQPEYKPLRIDGEDLPINDINELYTLASAGGKFTKKMQYLAPFERAVSAMEQNGISNDDINLLIEAKKGDKNALAKLVNQAGIDPLDIDETPDENYRPAEYGDNDLQRQIADVQAQISGDAEYGMTTKIVDELWDNQSREVLAQDPQKIVGLHQDIKSGIYQRVAPEATKLAIADGNKRSSIDYYMAAGNMLQERGAFDDLNPQVEAPVANSAPTETANRGLSNKRKRASASGGKRVATKDEFDYRTMSEEDDAILREQIMSRI